MANDQTPSDLPPAAVDALHRGRTIEAIKIVRLERRCDLRDAKLAVDDYIRRQPHLQRKIAEAQAESRRGCLTWTIGILLLLAAAYYFLGRP
jgi:hypothetical protein